MSKFNCYSWDLMRFRFGSPSPKVLPSHAEETEQVGRLNEEYLAAGGTIEEVPPGATGDTFAKATLREQAEYRREKRARSNRVNDHTGNSRGPDTFDPEGDQ